MRLGSLVEAGPAKDRRLPEGRTARTRQVDFLQTSSFSSITVVIFRPVYLKLTSSLHFLDNNVLFDQSAGETLHCFHSVPLSFALHQSLLCYILVLTSREGGGSFQHPVKTALWCLDRYFPPNQTCISCYFDVDSSLFTGLASVFVCFPQFLFCYSLHSFVQPLDLEEEAKKIRAAPPQPVSLHPFHVRLEVPQLKFASIFFLI